MKWDDTPAKGSTASASTAVGRYRVWQRNEWTWVGMHESGKHIRANDQAEAVAWCEADRQARVDAVLAEAPHG